MPKIALAALLLFISSLPAYSKPRDVYPVPCGDLWAAVKDALNRPRDYGIVLMDDASWKAAFTVIGNLTVFTNHVALRATGDGCKMKADIIEIGSDNPDWRQFHNRVVKSLAKVQAAKNGEPQKGPGPS